jgi:hypothetical protein
MRTVIIILAGFLLWGACVGVTRLVSGSPKTAMFVFLGLWFAAAAANMWIGVSQAGYSVREELPIFLLIFLVPATAAVLVNWKFN